MNLYEKVSEYVENWRRYRDIPVQEIATRLHMSPATYRRRMLHPEELTLKEVEKLEEILGKPIMEVVEDVYLQV